MTRPPAVPGRKALFRARRTQRGRVAQRGQVAQHGRVAQRGQRGSVTAEAAVVLPVLVAVVLGLVWLVSLGATQVRVVDAARETARAMARDDPTAQAIALGKQVAPDGARIDVQRGEGTVRVVVTAEVRGPGGIFGFLPGLSVDSASVAATEQQT
ncbi:MAG TPA: TadE family type IV pilus minor pilin [Nocardioidaceae bacterium]|nr:TadE family type IV pilus minor pilin [Nocardioidaceae bacterium]